MALEDWRLGLMDFFYGHVAELVEQISGVNREAIRRLLGSTPDRSMGDIAMPCFQLSKELREPPQAVAQRLSNAIAASIPPFLERTEAVGPYLNFHLNREMAASSLLRCAMSPGWGSSQAGKGRTVVIDFSSPNIAKPMHLGHLRSTVIGNSLKRIFEFQGWRTVGVNHLGDWGTQFGKLMVAYYRWGDAERVKEDPIDEMLSLYQMYSTRAQQDPSLEDEAREYFRRLENGDEEIRGLWQFIVDQSLEEIKRLYDFMNISFDAYTGESFYEDKMAAVVEGLQEKGLLITSEGAQVVPLDDLGLPPCLIVKSDGATIYATRDITAARYRRDHYGCEKILYVVDKGQSIHFRQVFAVLERAGYSWAKGLAHVAFGVLRVEGKRLRTRAGDVVYLEDLLDKAVSLAREIIEQKNPELADKEQVSRDVGIGAVVFNDLKHNRLSDVDFRWDEALSFEGQTGPYLQYTHARGCKLLRDSSLGETAIRSLVGSQDMHWNVFSEPEEWAVLSELAGFGGSIGRATQDMEPSVIAQHLLSLAQVFNRFYHDKTILKASAPVRDARLCLVYAVVKTVRTGLFLLGIGAPEQM